MYDRRLYDKVPQKPQINRHESVIPVAIKNTYGKMGRVKSHAIRDFNMSRVAIVARKEINVLFYNIKFHFSIVRNMVTN